MKRAVEWFLALREIPIERAHELITGTNLPAPDDAGETVTDRDGPVPYDTGLGRGALAQRRLGRQALTRPTPSTTSVLTKPENHPQT